MKIVTWNINGIRTFKGGIKRALDLLDADIICVQETKVTSKCLAALASQNAGAVSSKCLLNIKLCICQETCSMKGLLSLRVTTPISATVEDAAATQVHLSFFTITKTIMF